jgi:hypothetical protein
MPPRLANRSASPVVIAEKCSPLKTNIRLMLVRPVSALISYVAVDQRVVHPTAMILAHSGIVNVENADLTSSEPK